MSWLPAPNAASEERGPRLYLAALLLLVAGFSLAVPIGLDDTDIWYHLNAGRWIVEHKALPSTAWFSFIEPAPVVVDYSWLFDVAVYLVWSVAGFGGLVALRTALVLGVVVLAVDFLAEPAAREPDAASRARRLWWAAFAGTFVALLLLLRARDVRPHLVACLSMAALVWCFWQRPRWIVPPLVAALLWTNGHGASYPLLLAICGAALVDRVLARRRGEGDPRALVAAALPLLAIVLTPNLLALVTQPFVPVTLARKFIGEMAPLPLEALPSLLVSRGGIGDLTILQVVAVSGAIALLLAPRTAARLAPALLFVAGIALLFRGLRHTSDFAILVLPALRDMPLAASASSFVRRVPGAAWAAVASVLLAGHLGVRVDHARRPFTRELLPEGICRFIETQVTPVEGGSRLLQRPETGAYYEWRLPQLRIGMDMQLATVFRYDDYFALRTAQTDAASLRMALASLRPDLVAQRRESRDAPIARIEGWKPVFFDDADVLYADLVKHPSLEPLVAIDPHGLDALVPSSLDAGTRDAALAEIERVIAIDPEGVAANVAAARLLGAAGRHADALARADVALATAPASIPAREERGDALLALKRPADAAVEFFTLVGERTERTPLFRRRLAQCFAMQERHADAYEQLLAAWGGWPESATYADLYELAATASRAGANDDAIRWLRYAWLKAPAEDLVWRGKIEARLAALGAR